MTKQRRRATGEAVMPKAESPIEVAKRHVAEAEDKMERSESDLATRERRSWNAGRLVGAKRALKPRQVSAIRSG